MRFEIRKGDRAIGFTDDYDTAVQFFVGGYDVTGFTGYNRSSNEGR